MDIQQIILTGMIVSEPTTEHKDNRKIVIFTLSSYRPSFEKRGANVGARYNYYDIYKGYPLDTNADSFISKGMRVFVKGEPFIVTRENINLMAETRICVRATEVFALDKPIKKEDGKITKIDYENKEEIG